MSRKAPVRRARLKQKRLSPDDRRKEFVAKATEFFSEEGFGGGTRALARRLGVTQPLLYRYFPSKDDLIREVYRTVYLEPLDAGWEKLLVVPVGFVADHVETLYDLDIELRAVVEAGGMTYHRSHALNDDPRFIAALADVVIDHLARRPVDGPVDLGMGGPFGRGGPVTPGT